MKLTMEQIRNLAEQAAFSFNKAATAQEYCVVKSCSCHGVTETRGVIINPADYDNLSALHFAVIRFARAMGECRLGRMMAARLPPIAEGSAYGTAAEYGTPAQETASNEIVYVENWPLTLNTNIDGMLKLSERGGPKERGAFEADEKRYQECIAQVRLKTVLDMPLEPVRECPDCKGTKRYIGLNSNEPCALCSGTGFIPLGAK